MKKKSNNKLGLSFIPYNDIKGLDSEQRVKKILDIVLENRIVILQGKLEPLEEASLIQSTMALIGRIKGFKGVELAAIESEKELEGFDKFKEKIVHAILGQRDAITVIGPAAFVRDIKRDPSKIDLFFQR
jgi:hypothetical protein